MASQVDSKLLAHAEVVAALVVSKLHASHPPVAAEWLNFDQAAAYVGYPTTKAFRDRCSKPNPPPVAQARTSSPIPSF